MTRIDLDAPPRIAPRSWRVGLLLALALCAACRSASRPAADAPVAAAPVVAPPVVAGSVEFVRANYTKREVLIPMRDGVRLFTSIYEPKNTARTHPFLMRRTPYSVGPYGPDAYRETLGTYSAYDEAGYIFVNQDVRGRHMSEGEFVNMRPHNPDKRGTADIDESTDTYDTIAWLLANVPNHNDRVGLLGISYPGFYSSAGMIDAHPALRAVSPQAPIADWFFDDFRHHGAVFLPHAFNFLNGFGRPRPAPTPHGRGGIDHGTPDGYQFFLDLGPLQNADRIYFKGDVPYWNELLAHANYDDYWQARNILPHLKNVAPAVLTVGGWFDAEDLYGALKTYRAVEAQNANVFNALIMGPWDHGGWAHGDGDHLGNASFGERTSPGYRALELAFFEHHLKDAPAPDLPEAYVFETGTNRWRRFDRWPPADTLNFDIYFEAGGRLSFNAAESAGDVAFDAFVSDPSRPVPFSEEIDIGMSRAYMTDDQRFAARRPDVLVYQTPLLVEDLTLAGPMIADLWVSTSGTDSDWIVKLIDVYPPDAPDHPYLARGRRMGGYQMMVRSEVIRGRFRNSYERPQPFIPNEPARVAWELQDVLHTFQKGHRLMVQVQCTWFPLVDRNPQKYVENVADAEPSDFIAAEQRVYRSPGKASKLRVGALPARP